MKKTIITIAVLLFGSMNFLFAAEVDKNNTTNNEKYEIAYEQQKTEPVQTSYLQMKEKSSVKTKILNRILKKREQRLIKKIITKNKQITKGKTPVVLFIGAGLAITGMIFSLTGLYIVSLLLLIPAIILLIIGLFQMKR